jgi:hypothetical protein
MSVSKTGCQDLFSLSKRKIQQEAPTRAQLKPVHAPSSKVKRSTAHGCYDGF